jgi:sodium-coupled neutral amino acid transporter 11
MDKASHTSYASIQGSFYSSVFTLTQTAIGSACLFLPVLLSFSGVILGVLLIFGAGLVNYLSLSIIAKAANSTGKYDFAMMVEELLGSKFSFFLEVFVMLAEIGVLIGFQVVIGMLLPAFFDNLGLEVSAIVARDVCMVALNLLVMLPLSFGKELTKLAKLSLIGVFGILYIALLLIVEFPFFHADHGFHGLVLAVANPRLLVTITIALQTFFCHTNATKIQGELPRETSYPVMLRVIAFSILLQEVLYVSIALFGYLSVPLDTPTIIILRDPASGLGNGDIAMTVGLAIMIVTLVISIPINVNPCRVVMVRMCFKSSPSKVVHIVVTVALLEATLIIALFFPDVLLIFSFISGVCSSYIAMLLPLFLSLKLSKEPWSNGRNLGVSGLLMTCYLAGLSSVLVNLGYAVGLLS